MLTVCRSGITTLSLDLHDGPSRDYRRHTVGVGRGYKNRIPTDSTACVRFPAIGILERYRPTRPARQRFPFSYRRRNHLLRDKNVATVPTLTPAFPQQKVRSCADGYTTVSATRTPRASRTRLGSLHDAVFLDGVTRAFEVFEDLAVGSDRIGEYRIDLRGVE